MIFAFWFSQTLIRQTLCKNKLFKWCESSAFRVCIRFIFLYILFPISLAHCFLYRTSIAFARNEWINLLEWQHTREKRNENVFFCFFFGSFFSLHAHFALWIGVAQYVCWILSKYVFVVLANDRNFFLAFFLSSFKLNNNSSYSKKTLFSRTTNTSLSR